MRSPESKAVIPVLLTALATSANGAPEQKPEQFLPSLDAVELCKELDRDPRFRDTETLRNPFSVKIETDWSNTAHNPDGSVITKPADVLQGSLSMITEKTAVFEADGRSIEATCEYSKSTYRQELASFEKFEAEITVPDLLAKIRELINSGLNARTIGFYITERSKEMCDSQRGDTKEKIPCVKGGYTDKDGTRFVHEDEIETKMDGVMDFGYLMDWTKANEYGYKEVEARREAVHARFRALARAGRDRLKGIGGDIKPRMMAQRGR